MAEAVIAVVVVHKQHTVAVVEPQIRVCARHFAVTVTVAVNDDLSRVIEGEPPIRFACDLDGAGMGWCCNDCHNDCSPICTEG